MTRAKYGITPERRVLLLFGVLAERKGVLTVLQALRRLPIPVAETLSLVLAGPVEPEVRSALEEGIKQARRTPVQVLLHEGFYDEPAMRAFMAAADLVLVPYFDHPGTSSVLIRAAGAQRPVLSQSYGLMGEQVRAHGLGQVVDSRRVDAVAEAIERWCDAPGTGFDPAAALAFARTQTPDRYADALFEALGLVEKAD